MYYLAIIFLIYLILAGLMRILIRAKYPVRKVESFQEKMEQKRILREVLTILLAATILALLIVGKLSPTQALYGSAGLFILKEFIVAGALKLRAKSS